MFQQYRNYCGKCIPPRKCQCDFAVVRMTSSSSLKGEVISAAALGTTLILLKFEKKFSTNKATMNLAIYNNSIIEQWVGKYLILFYQVWFWTNGFHGFFLRGFLDSTSELPLRLRHKLRRAQYEASFSHLKSPLPCTFDSFFVRIYVLVFDSRWRLKVMLNCKHKKSLQRAHETVLLSNSIYDLFLKFPYSPKGIFISLVDPYLLILSIVLHRSSFQTMNWHWLFFLTIFFLCFKF